MPRMPSSSGGQNIVQQNSNWVSKPSYSPPNDNLKLVLLEDKLREDLAPQNVLLLPEVSKLPDKSYFYLYDHINQKLKRVSSATLKNVVLDDFDKKVEVDNILGYTFVDKLPEKADAKVNTIYIIPAEGRTTEQNYFEEFLFIKEQNDFEKIGNAATDLSDYRPADEQDILDKALKDLFLTKLSEHTNDLNNPHHVTKEQLGVHDDPELVFGSHFEFPNVGKQGLLYIATDEQITYYYDGTNYVAIKGDVPDIDYINCGGAN